MKALLVSLMLLPGLALGQFLPTSSSVTLNLDFSTDLNVDVLDFGTADGGTLHVQGTTYSVAGEIPTLASDLFSFGTGDGGTLHISGPLYADDATVADDFVCTDDAEVGGLFSVAGVTSLGVADAGTVHVSGTAYAGDVVIADDLTVTDDTLISGILSVQDIFSWGTSDGGTLHVSGTGYLGDVTIADDLVCTDAAQVGGAFSVAGVSSFGVADGGTLHVSGTAYLGAVAVAGASNLASVTATTIRADEVDAGMFFGTGLTAFYSDEGGIVAACENLSCLGSHIPIIYGDKARASNNYLDLGTTPDVVTLQAVTDLNLSGGGNNVHVEDATGTFVTDGLHSTAYVEIRGGAGLIVGGPAYFEGATTNVLILDAGTIHGGATYVDDLTTADDLTVTDDALISGILSVQDVFSFGIGDGGTLHLAGPAYVDDLTTADDLTVTDDLIVTGAASVQDVFTWGISDGGTLHLSGPAYLGTTVAVGGNATMSGTLGVADVFSFGVGDGGTLHVSGPAYVADMTAADDVTVADALNVTGLASIVTLDAGIAYAADFRSPSSNVTFGSWLTDGDSAGPAVEDRNMMGPFYSTSVPGRFGEMVCNWETAGTGGTTGVVMSVFNVTDTSVLCSCTLGACTTAAYDPLRCSCSQYFLAGKVYVGRITTATDCASNPTKIHCTIEVMR